MRIDCVSPIQPLCGIYKSAPRYKRGGENPLTTGVKQAVPYRTGREAARPGICRFPLNKIKKKGAGKTGNEGMNKLLLTTPVARPGSWFL